MQVLEGFDASGVPRLRAPVRPITLRHLLTHTAGYGYPVWSEALGRYHEVQGLPSTSTCRNAALLAPLLFDPGERWNYGINIEWAGKVIEAVTGQRLGVYLTRHFFEPLGMSSTAFKITSAMRARLAKVHERAADGSLCAIELEVPQEPEFELGGGGLYSTAGDYLQFVRMILNDGQSSSGERVLAPETVDLMSRNHIGELAVVKLQTCMPNRSNDAEFFPGTVKRWGLSFMINEEAVLTGRSAGGLAWGGLATRISGLIVRAAWAESISPRSAVRRSPLSAVVPSVREGGVSGAFVLTHQASRTASAVSISSLREAPSFRIAALTRMPLHDGPLFGGELAGLEQDMIRNADFADIVQRAEIATLSMMGPFRKAAKRGCGCSCRASIRTNAFSLVLAAVTRAALFNHPIAQMPFASASFHCPDYEYTKSRPGGCTASTAHRLLLRR